VRDEESETQRKAHAKRVRETRRSTQGVTLDEIKSAEQLVKKKQQLNNDVGLQSGTTSIDTATTTTLSTSSSATVSQVQPVCHPCEWSGRRGRRGRRDSP
jgi:protein phosphatase 1 regulatory subunit 12A